MTNRRKGTKGRTTAAKKSESPEKQTRRLSRRSKRNRKSESPEPEPEENSDNSAVEDNTEESERRDEDRDDNDNQKGEDSDNGMYSRNSDEPKSQLKEEESAGSDGSWKVKSENGGGGGIPKLKLCLTRPPEMSSPTSESSPSPRRRGRKPKGIASPAKDETVEEPVVEEKESPKRSTRSSRAKAVIEQEPPTVVERTELTPPPEEPPSVSEVTPLREVTPPKEEIEEQIPLPQEVPTYQEDCDSTNINHDEAEDETRLAVESISIIQPPEDTQVNLTQRLRERITRREEPPPEEEPVSSVKEEEEKEAPAPEVEIQQQVEPEAEPQPEPEPEPVKEVEREVEKEPEKKDQPMEEEPEPKQEQEPEREKERVQVVEERRSSSRDSSEERAKQEALMSRKRNKKVEEPVEVAQSRSSPKNENISRSEEESKPTSTTPSTNDNEQKDTTEEHTPVVRKRRWGSSSSRVAKKPSVSISTDFLKEIIPEVKPLPMSEVHLSPNEDEEEGQLKDSEDSVPVVTKKQEREKIIQSEESEKDYEEENVESGAEETPQAEPVKPAPVKEKEYTTFTRKVSVVSSNDLNTLQKSPSPPRNKPSNILYIVNLVRPFTIPQLRELLARTGTIVEDGFWIDKIKSKCYVKYETEEQAQATRHALHGVQWPVSNPKTLNVDYGTESAMKAAQEGNETATKRLIPSLFDKQIDVKANEKAKEREKEREERSKDRREKLEQDRKERLKHREDERKEEEEREKKRPTVEPLTRDRTVRRVTVPVREWDVGKNEDGFSPPPDGLEYGRHRDDRYERRVEYDRDKRDDYDDRRRRERDRGRRSLSGEPPRKAKKKSEDEAPAKLLDDLFRKTKATPCIYWLPLTTEQIAVKEEMRRKHMADHEKKIAELRKIQREQSKRSSDKRRRRTRSRSRSRSPKK